MRWLLCLTALSALSAVGRSALCRCVDPVTCPEAVMTSKPRGCRLPGKSPLLVNYREIARVAAYRGPGVCCPTFKASNRTPTFNIKIGRGAKRAVFSAAVVSGGRRGERRLLRRSRLPPGTRSFMQRVALDSGDNVATRTVVAARRRIRLFTTVVLPTKRRQGRRRSRSKLLRFLRAVGVVIQAKTPPARPSGTTRVFYLNSRTSPESQRQSLQSLQILQQSRVRPTHKRVKRAAPARRRTRGTARRCRRRRWRRSCRRTSRSWCKVRCGRSWCTGRWVYRGRRRRRRRRSCAIRGRTKHGGKCIKRRRGGCIKRRRGRCIRRRRGKCIKRGGRGGRGQNRPPGYPPSRPPPLTDPVRVSPSGVVLNCTPAGAVRCAAAAKYRTITGQCNNLRRPRWGRSLTGLRRVFDNTFEDGVFAPRRRSAAGGTLPSARAVSVGAFRAAGAADDRYTMSVVTFGQFMDHDLSISPHFQLSTPGGGLRPIECCGRRGRALPSARRHPQCFPIAIAASDPLYRRHGVRCMNFVRSVPAPEPQCRPRPATQLNELTSWMDLSQVYGNTEEKSRELRAFRGGRLRTSVGNLLPREVPRKVQPATNCASRVCFIAGDVRVNENTLLTLFHTVFLREHNRVAVALAARHRWSDETLFQEARRLVVAEWQHVAFDEWLPTIVSFRFSGQVGLGGAGRNTYASFLNPSISTEFSTAGFRLHSMVKGVIELVSKVGTIRQRLQLRDNFFRPDSLVVASLFSEMARGLTRQRPKRFDRSFAQAVRGDLFRVGAVGLDLMALNIQRGRDHGIPTYATVATRCNGVQISSWASFGLLIPVEDVALLRATYRHWRDVDLFVGLNLERPAAGALVGPTTRCLLTDQFLRARYGDRFFYDQAGQSGSFTAEQLREIRRASWARLLCDNVGRGFDAVQPMAFVRPTGALGMNPVVSCNSPRIKRVNLNRF